MPRSIRLILISCVVTLGCSPPIDTALPLVEPTMVERPTSRAQSDHRESLSRARRSLDEPDSAWPQLFGPYRTSVLPDHHVNVAWPDEGPVELWSVPCGTGYGSPVTAAGRVVFNHRMGDEEIVSCVSVEDGSTVWQHRYPTTFDCNYDYSSGPYSTPVIDGSCVYAAGGQGQFYCLESESGEVLWSRNFHDEYGLEDDSFPVGSAPLVVDNMLIFNVGAIEHNAGVIAMDRETGETIWTATDQGAAYCTPITATIHNQRFLFVMTVVGLVSLEPETGRVDWVIEHRCRSPLSFNAVSPLVLDDKVFAISGPSPGAICVQVQPDRSYKKLWKDRRVLDSQYNTLMLSEGLVYGFTAAGQGGAELRCIDLATGELHWKYHSVLRRGQGLIAGDTLILLGEKGHLASLARNGEEPIPIAFTTEPLMQEPCYCAPAIHGSKLILKDETRVACFSLAL